MGIKKEKEKEKETNDKNNMSKTLTTKNSKRTIKSVDTKAVKKKRR